MRASLRPSAFVLECCFYLFAFLALCTSLVDAQSTTTLSSPSLTTATISSSFTTVSVTRSGGQDVTITTVLPTVFNVTLTIAPTATSSSSPSSAPITLDTKIDPGFGVLGAILIITGLPSTFWGHKNRWSSFFLIGFYTFALACLALILRFGVLDSVNPPSQTLRGVFVLACCIAGFGGGGVAIFFWQQAKYFIGAWGGFALGLWVQCFRNGGVIRSIGFRWILYIGLGVVGFCLCTVPKFHYPVLLASTAAVGATAFILGIDCFTTAGLKEFYVWNLGFDTLFPKFKEAGIQFPVGQMMQIELGLIGAFAVMGMAVQLRILKILQIKLREIKREQRRRDEELEAQATARFAATTKEMADWERLHGKKGSSSPLIKDGDFNSPETEEASQFTLPYGHERRQRYQSGVSDFVAAPPLEDELGRPIDRRQSIGALPALDLGADIEKDIPSDFVEKNNLKASTLSPPASLSPQELEDLKRKEGLMAEIQSIRKSIEMLRAETPSSGRSESRSRQHSFTSRRTLSQDLAKVMEAPTRPPRSQDPRARVSSLEMLRASSAAASSSRSQDGASIGRPSSAPLQEQEQWDSYVRERKLFQPPAGVTAPIGTTAIAPQPKRATQAIVPNSVSEALLRRYHQESVLGAAEFGLADGSGRVSAQGSSSDGRHVNVAANAKSSKVPVTIMPPKRPDAVVAPPARPSPPRTRTFEELNERHRQMMRSMQSPISRAERERADVEAARQRWERSNALEKQAMAKKELEKQLASKEKKVRGGREEGSPRAHPDRRTDKKGPANAEMMVLPHGNGGSSSKRQSTLKVEDWRRFQQDAPGTMGAPVRDSAVPFPGTSRDANRSPGEGRRGSQMLGSLGRRI